MPYFFKENYFLIFLQIYFQMHASDRILELELDGRLVRVNKSQALQVSDSHDPNVCAHSANKEDLKILLPIVKFKEITQRQTDAFSMPSEYMRATGKEEVIDEKSTEYDMDEEVIRNFFLNLYSGLGLCMAKNGKREKEKAKIEADFRIGFRASYGSTREGIAFSGNYFFRNYYSELKLDFPIILKTYKDHFF